MNHRQLYKDSGRTRSLGFPFHHTTRKDIFKPTILMSSARVVELEALVASVKVLE